MHARELFSKTLPFCMAKLLLGLLATAVSVVILAVLMGIAWLFNADGVTGVLLLVWLAAVGVVRFVLMHYAGYLVKAGHIAVIAEAVTTGRVPEDQVAYGKRMVTERFGTANVYFAVDKLVSGAIKQLQGHLQRAGNALDAIPGMAVIVRIGQLFLDISLGYIDECCLGYAFYKRGQGAFKSAADGVVLYTQNWRKLLSGAAKTTFLVVGLCCAVAAASLVVLGVVCTLFGLPGYIAFLIACLITFAVKFAFIDSYVLVSMMAVYMEAAPSAEISFDLYGKLCAVSSKFAELYEKGRNEAARPEHEAHLVHSPCGACGEENAAGSGFCGNCGAALL